MNKANLYKRSNPMRDIDSVVVNFGGFVDYYNAYVDGTVGNDNRKIRKKKINLDPRAEKLSFTSGR